MKFSKFINEVSALQYFQLLRFSTLILIGIFLTKSGYETSEIGVYELFFFLANVLGFFWNMGLKNALVSYYPKLDKVSKDRLFFNLLHLLILFGFLAAGILFFGEPYIAYLLNPESSISGGEIGNLDLIILYIVLSGPGNFTEYYYLLKERNKAIIQYGTIIFLFQLTLIGFGVAMGFSIRSLLWLVVAWATVKFIWILFLIIKNEKLNYV